MDALKKNPEKPPHIPCGHLALSTVWGTWPNDAGFETNVETLVSPQIHTSEWLKNLDSDYNTFSWNRLNSYINTYDCTNMCTHNKKTNHMFHVYTAAFEKKKPKTPPHVPCGRLALSTVLGTWLNDAAFKTNVETLVSPKDEHLRVSKI